MVMKSRAIIIAGTHSGCGKTTVTLGLMAALSEMAGRVQPFKCGPDFIDPILHQQVTGVASRNLDVRMCGADFVRNSFYRHLPQDGIAIIEGVMGLFDGGQGSAAYLATLLQIPVILVVDVRSAAESVAAVVKGFETLNPKLDLAGVIFNRVGSPRHRELVEGAVKEHCQSKIIGFLPRNEQVSVGERHLGLKLESELDRRSLSSFIGENVDLNSLLSFAEIEVVAGKAKEVGKQEKSGRLAVAWDDAFCFYYLDNLDMLENAGIELVFFSPMLDKGLPADIDGIYLGGGYPELHAAELSANESMRRHIKSFSRSGKPVYGECGGFMYLSRELVSQDGNVYPMAGVFPTRASMRRRMRRLGYRRAELKEETFWGSAGDFVYGHEFHYSDIEPMGDEVRKVYCLDDGKAEGYMVDNTLAGYMHLHWGRTPEAAGRFALLLAGK